MNKVFILSSLVLVLLFLGCGSKEPTPVKETEVKPCTCVPQKQLKKPIVKKPVIKKVKKEVKKDYFYMPYMKSVPFASSDENRMKKLVSDLSKQLIKNSSSDKIKNSPIHISSFAPLNGMNTNQTLSAILSEYLIYEMQIRGHKVVEDRVQKSKKTTINNTLKGTYSSYKNSVVVNARIVDAQTDIVLSSAQVLIPIQVVSRVTSKKKQVK